MPRYQDCLAIHTILRIIFFQLDNKIRIYLLPSLWLFYSRILNNIISKLHERSLTNTLNDFSKAFNALLEKKQDTNNHHRYIQTLVTEVFRMKNEPALSTMESIVYTGISIYEVRNFQEFEKERERLFVMVWKRLVRDILTPDYFCSKFSKKWILKAKSKATLADRFAVTVLPGSLKFILKTFGFYDVKP